MPTVTDKLFELLCKAMNGNSRIAQRVTNHVRAVSSHSTLVTYHLNGAPDEERRMLYAELLAAIRKNDFSTLKGQVAAGQATEADSGAEPQPAPEAQPSQPEPKSRKPILRRKPKPIIEVEAETTSEAPLATDPATQLATALRALMGPIQAPRVEIDEARVMMLVTEKVAQVENSVNEFAKNRVEEYLKSIPPRDVVEIRPIQGDKFDIPRQHYKFPLLMACLAQRIPVCLTGPAGSSKSTACKAAADALKLPFGTVNFGPTTSKADLFGYKDANGVYHSTEMVRTALSGGVFCGDEFDSGHAGVATMINMPLANRIIPTPEGTKPVHEDWIPVFCANTYGTGANRMYVGRNQLDAATLDRMAFIEWDYDSGLEGAIIGVEMPSPPFDLGEGGTLDPKRWLDAVSRTRTTVAKLGIRHLVTPRASIYGAKLLAAGVGLKHVEDIVLWKGLDAESIKKVKENL